jgi:hypothetical protein
MEGLTKPFGGLKICVAGIQAAIAAGYSEKSAGVTTHRLLKNPVITKELELFFS